MDRQRVLFLCTGNSARSQMAEAFLRHCGGDRFEAYSAGFEPKGINPYTVRVMQEKGIDLQGQTSKDIVPFLGRQHFSYVIPVCERAEEKCPTVFPGAGKILNWVFEDPAEATGDEQEILMKFREVRDQIELRIKQWLDQQDA